MSDKQKRHYLQSRLVLLKAGFSKAQKEGDYDRVHHFQEAISHLLEEIHQLSSQS